MAKGGVGLALLLHCTSVRRDQEWRRWKNPQQPPPLSAIPDFQPRSVPPAFSTVGHHEERILGLEGLLIVQVCTILLAGFGLDLYQFGRRQHVTQVFIQYLQ